MLSDTYIALTLNVQYCNICTPSLFSCPSERLVCWRYIVCVSCWPSDSTSIEKHRTAGPVCTQSPYHTHTHTHTQICTQLQFRWSNKPLFMCLLAEFGVWAWLWACTCTKCLIWYQTWCEQSEGAAGQLCLVGKVAADWRGHADASLLGAGAARINRQLIW